jgi:TetR/AcrR family transcriptional regulator, regulator of autoinduction and epiphytic fitness
MSQTMQSEAVDSEPAVDGRTMRRTRNRTSVINALLSMIREGDLRPAAADIADRAGVSHRSIFRYFDDLDDLVRTTIAQAFREVGALSAIPDIGEGDFEGRVARFVDARIKLLEFVDRPMQLARARANSIPSIDEQLSSVAEFLRSQIHEHFAPELDTLDEAVRAAVVDAVLVLTSYDGYYAHVQILHDDTDHIRATWNRSLSLLLSN